VHADRYYQLDLTIFKTSLDSRLIDLLWNKYWVNTLASSPLLASKAFVAGQLDDASTCLPCVAPFIT
jgi:COP9 signalosome complex subunit 5